MKDRIISIGLGIVLAASLVGNVYIYNQQQTLTTQLAAQEQQAATLTTQIADTDAQKQQLQGQLEQLGAQLKAAQDETIAAQEQAAQLVASIPVVPAFAPSPSNVENVQEQEVSPSTAEGLLIAAGIGGRSSGSDYAKSPGNNLIGNGGQMGNADSLNNALDGATW